MRFGAFVYGKIILKSDLQPTIDAIADEHERVALERIPWARFERLPAATFQSRSGHDPLKSIFRVGHIHDGYKGPEYSLYLEHTNGVLLLVLLCPDRQEDIYVPILKWIAEKSLIIDCVDTRPSRTRETLGRISTYWNRAKYVEVFERSETGLPWRKTQEFIEVTEPVRSLSHLPSPTPERPLVLESCEFVTTIIPTDGAVRNVIPDVGWTIPLWGDTHVTPRILLRFDDMFPYYPDLNGAPEEERKHINKTMELDSLRIELSEFLAKLPLPSRIVDDEDSWRTFLGFYFKVVAECPFVLSPTASRQLSHIDTISVTHEHLDRVGFKTEWTLYDRSGKALGMYRNIFTDLAGFPERGRHIFHAAGD